MLSVFTDVAMALVTLYLGVGLLHWAVWATFTVCIGACGGQRAEPFEGMKVILGWPWYYLAERFWR